MCFFFLKYVQNAEPSRYTRLSPPFLLYLVGGLEHFFPTCQVRVVRFYQSCSSPPPPSPPPPLHPLPCSLPPCQLFAKLFANFRTQWALLDLNCKGLSALGTAGPQPGTFRAQWAPLDLNLGPQPGTLRAQWKPLDLKLGPSELSEHRWTSTAR